MNGTLQLWVKPQCLIINYTAIAAINQNFHCWAFFSLLTVALLTAVLLTAVLLMAALLHMNNLKWQTLKDRHNRSRLCIFYKMIQNQAAIPYRSYIQHLNYLNSRYLNTMKFLPVSCSKNSYKQSFFPNTIPHWNKLLTEIVNSSSLTIHTYIHIYIYIYIYIYNNCN